MLGNKEIDSPHRLRRLTNELFAMMDETPYIVLRGFDIDIGKVEGYWYFRDNVLGWPVESFTNMEPTQHFEFRDDGYWGQVYRVKTPE